MDYVERELFKTSKLVRQVPADQVPADVKEPTDWRAELYDDYDWPWYEWFTRLYWVLIVVVFCSVLAGFLYARLT